jgi:hypothetical protein
MRGLRDGVKPCKTTLPRVGRLVLALGCGLCLPALAPGAKPSTVPPVQVVVLPVKVEQRTFDPRNPPPGMPQLVHPEAAVCSYGFSCASECRLESTRVLLKYKPARITSVKITVGLEVTIWLPLDATPKLIGHELAHKQLCEEVYRQAEGVAHGLGTRLIGYSLQHSVKNKAAVEAEVARLQHELAAAYARRIADRCTRMQQYFDFITNHGIDPIAESEAIARALAQEPDVL